MVSGEPRTTSATLPAPIGRSLGISPTSAAARPITSAGAIPAAREIAHARVAICLAQLLRRGLHHQWVVQELWRRRTPDETRELNLPARGRQQVVAAYDVRHALIDIVNSNGELIRPIPLSVDGEEVAALFKGALFECAVTKVDKSLSRRRKPNANAAARLLCQTFRRARAGIAELILQRHRRRHDVAARALARINETQRTQSLKSLRVNFRTIALTTQASAATKAIGRRFVGNKPKPVEVVENRALEFGAASLTIVIFDAKQYAATKRLRDAPHVNGVHDVPKMKEAGRSWSETGNHGSQGSGVLMVLRLVTQK